MSDFMSSIKTINSSVRTIMIVGACGVVGYGGYFGYENFVKPSQEAKQVKADFESLKSKFDIQGQELAGTIAAKERIAADLKVTTENLEVAEELNERLETSMKLLKVDRRVANITVLRKEEDENGNTYMEVSFTEVDGKGKAVGPAKNYTLKGEKFYVDGWVASFKDKYVEEADGLRAASLFVFKSIYGDAELPKDAQRLDVESIDHGPGIYQDSKKRDFERAIWKDFWKVCNDEGLQDELGIRASHGQSSYVFGRVGKTYEISIRASGGMSLTPVEP